ncbi:DUF4879 domain-containing protein [Acetobacter lambici]|nr:DUF4879 domain-containing protein [Acetobacter lambici]MCP1243909.1 YolA family protein [Acetobacter lambici]NHO58305.1 DUF4879 domain-containing protein [Acetobacter lambici]
MMKNTILRVFFLSFVFGMPVLEPVSVRAESLNGKQEISLIKSIEPLKLNGTTLGVVKEKTVNVQVRSIAPPLTDMWVYAVASSNCGVEYMTAKYQASTTCDHGGAMLRIAVIEVGYGKSTYASMNNTELPKTNNYQTIPMCVKNNQYYWPCDTGDSVVGFVKLWSADGYQGGVFKNVDISANPPVQSLSTTINIK